MHDAGGVGVMGVAVRGGGVHDAGGVGVMGVAVGGFVS